MPPILKVLSIYLIDYCELSRVAQFTLLNAARDLLDQWSSGTTLNRILKEAAQSDEPLDDLDLLALQATPGPGPGPLPAPNPSSSTADAGRRAALRSAACRAWDEALDSAAVEIAATSAPSPDGRRWAFDGFSSLFLSFSLAFSLLTDEYNSS